MLPYPARRPAAARAPIQPAATIPTPTAWASHARRRTAGRRFHPTATPASTIADPTATRATHAASPPSVAAPTQPAPPPRAPHDQALQGGTDPASPDEPQARRHRLRPGSAIPLQVGQGVRHRQRGPGEHRDRHEQGEGRRQRSAGADPGEDREQGDPDHVWHPRPAGALQAQVVGQSDREPGRGQGERREPCQGGQGEAGRGRPERDPGRGRAPDPARGNRLAGLRDLVRGGVGPVVRRPDRQLQEKHRRREERDEGRPGPRDGGDSRGDGRVEERGKGVDEPEDAAEARPGRRRPVARAARTAVRRRRAPRSSRRGSRPACRALPARWPAGP